MLGIKTIPRNYVLIGIFLVVIVLGLLRTINEDYFSRKKVSPNYPQAIMENVTVTQMGVNGYPTEKLVSPKLINYKDNNTTYITSPHFTLYSPPGQPWEITSDYGRATDGITEVYLWQNVVMQQPADKLHPPSVMTTEHFTVYPNTKTGYTDAPIKLIQPGMQVTAIGATADLVKKKITLLSHAQGIYSNSLLNKKQGTSHDHATSK